MYFSGCFSWLLLLMLTLLFSLVLNHRLLKPDFELGYFLFVVTVGRSTASLSPEFPALLLLCSPRSSGAPVLRAVMLQHEQRSPCPAFPTFVAALFLEGIKVILLFPPIITISVL